MKIKPITAWAVYLNTGEYSGQIKGFRWALGVYATKRYAQVAAKEQQAGKYRVLKVKITPINK